MGAGIYLWEAARQELALHKAAGVLEWTVTSRLLLRGLPCPGRTEARGGAVTISRTTTRHGREMLLINAFAIYVQPMDDGRLQRAQRQGLVLDDRGAVNSTGEWFTAYGASDEDYMVDVYNTEVCAVRRWTGP